MLKYIEGDLFDFLRVDDMIAHVCNDVGGFGSGFAGALAQRYPRVRKDFLRWSESGVHIEHKRGEPICHPYQLGEVQIVPLLLDANINLPFYAANMVAQHGIISPGNPHPIRYDALKEAMIKVVSLLCIVRARRIIAPKFGAGLAGGDWNIIEELINEVWKDLEVVIVTLPH